MYLLDEATATAATATACSYRLCMKLQSTRCCSCSRYAVMLLYVWLFKSCALLHTHFTPITSVLLSNLSMRLSNNSSREHKQAVNL